MPCQGSRRRGAAPFLPGALAQGLPRPPSATSAAAHSAGRRGGGHLPLCRELLAILGLIEVPVAVVVCGSGGGLVPRHLGRHAPAFLLPPSPGQGGKNHYRCEKRLREKQKKKETQTKKRFSLILKVTFLLLALWEKPSGGPGWPTGKGKGFSVPSRPFPPRLARSPRGRYPLGKCAPPGSLDSCRSTCLII